VTRARWHWREKVRDACAAALRASIVPTTRWKHLIRDSHLLRELSVRQLLVINGEGLMNCRHS